MNGWVAKASTALLIALMVGSVAEAAPKRLSKEEAQACHAKGGYESRAPFGAPICQFRYADAGKVCSDKKDCFGRCLSEGRDDGLTLKVGTPISGRCEAEQSTFGCYGVVDGGRLTEPYDCTD
jgi:hypothetical protein